MQETITIRPGGLYEATFIARNLPNEQKNAQAAPGAAPRQAASYFKKLERFCFATRKFAAGK